VDDGKAVDDSSSGGGKKISTQLSIFLVFVCF
jgi:hypothetical protein